MVQVTSERSPEEGPRAELSGVTLLERDSKDKGSPRPALRVQTRGSMSRAV